jgi:WD40 repeat protein
MDSLSSSLTSFDDININCVVHEIPSIGVCADYFCKEKKFFCMRCIADKDTCITISNHELVSLSELLYRFFIKQETKAIDLVEINSMMEALKEFERSEITKNLSDFTKSCQLNISKFNDDFNQSLKDQLETVKNDNIVQFQQLNNKIKNIKSESENVNILIEITNGIPKCLLNFNPHSIKSYLKSESIKRGDKENLVRILKFFTNYDRIMKIISTIDDINYLNKLTSKENMEGLEKRINNKLNEIEEKINKRLEEIEKVLIPPKENVVIIKSGAMKFSNDPINLVFRLDICDTAHKSNSIDSVFSAFKSLKGEMYVVWGTPSYTIEVYDLKLEKIIKTLFGAHTSTIFSCRHYLDKKNKSDLVISSSYDRSVKLWSVKENWANILTIPTAHSGYYIYSVCVLSDEIELKNYIISAAPNEYMKIWDFTGKCLKDFGVSNESTYFINSWYDTKNKKYYILNANSVDVKVYDFKTALLYKSYKGNPQTWHMSAIVNEVGNNTNLIESDGNGNVRIWNFHTGLLIMMISSGSSGINLRGICLWNDNFLFASGSDNNVRLYDIRKGIYLKAFPGHTTTVCALDKIIHPKYGECLISHALDGKLKIWSAK